MLPLFSRMTLRAIIAVCCMVSVVVTADARVRFHSTHGWNTGGKTGNKQERIGGADVSYDAGTGTLIIGCYGLPFATCWEISGNDIWVYGVIGKPGSAGTIDYCTTTGSVTVTVE